MNSLIPYKGGKGNLLPDIERYFRMSGCRILVEVFGGSGKVSLNIRAHRNVYNDLDDDIFNLFQVVKERPKALQRAFERHLPIDSKTYFAYLKESKPRTKVDRAYRTFMLFTMSFGGRGEHYGPVYLGMRSTFKTAEMKLDNIMELHAIIRNWTIEHTDFRDLMRKYDSPQTFFYLDPPYWGFDWYNHNFEEHDFQDLKGFLDGMQGKYLMNINPSEEVRRVFGEPQADRLYSNSTVNTRETGGKKSVRSEWFYTNVTRGTNVALDTFVDIQSSGGVK